MIDVVALLLGVGISVVVAVLAAGVADTTDPSMRWEGGVAPGWLWAWLFLGPLLATSRPAIGAVRSVKRLHRRG